MSKRKIPTCTKKTVSQIFTIRVHSSKLHNFLLLFYKKNGLISIGKVVAYPHKFLLYAGNAEVWRSPLVTFPGTPLVLILTVDPHMVVEQARLAHPIPNS